LSYGVNPGPKPYLSSKEESKLAVYLTTISKAGCGKTRWQVMGIVQHVILEKISSGNLKSETESILKEG